MTGSDALRKVLVANRGEIALRVMRACREERIASVAVYMEGESGALHARYADEAVQLVSEAPLPYIDADAVLRAATESGADAIHPGYGFLAENSQFARACQEAGFVFIGPPPDAIKAMGDKISSRRVAIEAGVPVVPGTNDPATAAEARAFGDKHGYPIAIKAVGGGGGRGLRVVNGPEEIEAAWESARSEAERYFGYPDVYVERFLHRPRHIEIQVFADVHGNVVALGERDCSIQRRHQKLVEEAPSPALDAATREKMSATAVKLVQQVGYVGAGTVEFLYSDGEFYFLEMNTRIQVEHPVTEEITGIDLVREQLRVAAGKPLSFQDMPPLFGHAIECRINAEDPARDFAPTPGRLTAFLPPSGFGVRVDTGFEEGGEVDPRFDNLIAKLIVRGRDREEALSRLARALADFKVDGVATPIPLFQALLRRPDFAAGDYDTGYLERIGLASTLAPFEPSESVEARDGRTIEVEVDGRTYRVKLPEGWGAAAGNPRRQRPSRRPVASGTHSHGGPAGNELKSPIQGTVLSVAVEPGQEVEIGQLVCVVEAMKMENELTAHRAGTVTAVNVEPGNTVRTGEVVAVIE